MSVNDAPLARIRKSISSSSADQIVELFGAPVRTISTPLPIFFAIKSKIAIRQIMAAGIPKTTAYRLGSRRGARRIGSVTTVSPAGGPHRAFGCGQGRQDGGSRGRTPAHSLHKCVSAPALLLSEFQY
jgi:hypothetical protein